MRTITLSIHAGPFEFRKQSYTPDCQMEWHTHELAEFCMLLRGSLTERLKRRSLRYSPLDIGYKPADLDHRVDIGPAGAHCLVVTLPTTSTAPHMAGALGRGPAGLFRNDSLIALGWRAVRELGIEDDCTSLALEGVALELLAGVARVQPSSNSEHRPAWFRRACDRLKEGFPAALPLHELAGSVGVSPTRLAQAFRREYGCSIGTFVRRLRVARAKQLLAHSEATLAAIGCACGFHDQSHFTRSFRAHVGTTPGAFRHSPSADPCE